MVWGMSLPKGFGEFWPEGGFEYSHETDTDGWTERLRAYYLEQTPERRRELLVEDKEKVYEDKVYEGVSDYPFYVFGKFINECGTRQYPERPPVIPIEPHEAPTFYETRIGYKKLGALIMLNNRIVAVDEDLKGIIERLEPNVHQFFPMKIIMGRKQAIYPASYYTMAIGQYFDSFSPEESKEDSYSQSSAEYYYHHEETKKGVTGLAFRKAVFGGAHLWRERRFREWLTCFSDELQAEIAKAGLRLPKHYRMKEV